MDNSPASDGTASAQAPANNSIPDQLKPLPYRWGYFQGAALIPWSLLILLSVASDSIKPHHDPWYLLTIGFLMGFWGLPLAYGLLRKKSFSLFLVYLMFGLSILLVASNFQLRSSTLAIRATRVAPFLRQSCCCCGLFPWCITASEGPSFVSNGRQLLLTGYTETWRTRTSFSDSPLPGTGGKD